MVAALQIKTRLAGTRALRETAYFVGSVLAPTSWATLHQSQGQRLHDAEDQVGAGDADLEGGAGVAYFQSSTGRPGTR